MAVALAVAGIAVLIYFIHHVASSIQAPNVIDAVSRELHDIIDNLFPEEVGTEDESASRLEEEVRMRQLFHLPNHMSAQLKAPNEGFIVRIDPGMLMAAAESGDLMIRAERKPGEFVTMEDSLFTVVPRERVTPSLHRRILSSAVVGPARSITQDLLFPIDQLCEMAMRGMSGGSRAPHTPADCVDRLGSGLAKLTGRSAPSPLRRGRDGKARVLAYPVSFADALKAAFEPMTPYLRRRGRAPIDPISIEPSILQQGPFLSRS